ncbi:hypothetical protein D3C73_265470 [compost metagenome]
MYLFPLHLQRIGSWGKLVNLFPTYPRGMMNSAVVQNEGDFMSFRINKNEQNAKKALPAYLIGLFGMLLSVVIALGILGLTDFELYSYSILFVFPLGAIALGMISTSVYTWRIVTRGYEPSRQNYAVSLIMALITFFRYSDLMVETKSKYLP